MLRCTRVDHEIRIPIKDSQTTAQPLLFFYYIQSRAASRLSLFWRCGSVVFLLFSIAAYQISEFGFGFGIQFLYEIEFRSKYSC